jgi:protein-tyrosine phosphatase
MTAKSRSPPAKKRTPRPTGPSEVALGLFVGGWKDALAFDGERFCVLDEAPPDMPPATHIPIYDEATGSALRANLDRLSGAIGSARRRGRAVLVFCGHGVRRSPLGAAWYLHRSENVPLSAAFEQIEAVRPKVERPEAWVENPASLAEP